MNDDVRRLGSGARISETCLDLQQHRAKRQAAEPEEVEAAAALGTVKQPKQVGTARASMQGCPLHGAEVIQQLHRAVRPHRSWCMRFCGIPLHYHEHSWVRTCWTHHTHAGGAQGQGRMSVPLGDACDADRVQGGPAGGAQGCGGAGGSWKAQGGVPLLCCPPRRAGGGPAARALRLPPDAGIAPSDRCLVSTASISWLQEREHGAPTSRCLSSVKGQPAEILPALIPCNTGHPRRSRHQA